MPRILCGHGYDHIISVENLLEAWSEFKNGKRKRKDVQEFERDLMENIISLHTDLASKKYRHSPYEAFNISDPKPRNIHKASVRDRLLHHALHRKLYPFFDKTFISDSYSCRFAKGSHRAMERFKSFGQKVSKNRRTTAWILKCDVRKFFASVDQGILLDILKRYVPDEDVVQLFSRIVGSFHSTTEGVGLPLGNLTSQLLVNIYMNKFDHFMKHTVKAKYYIRYADDFVILLDKMGWLESIIPVIGGFLADNLHLSLHPDKVFIKTLASGVDFLGWVHFPSHRTLRTVTKKRMMKKIAEDQNGANITSYLGMLSHGDAHTLSCLLLKICNKNSP